MPIDGKRYSLGRRDNDIGYVVGNIRWETDLQQSHNKRKLKRNTSGVTGVQLTHDKTRWSACWNNITGKHKYKGFSIKKYGHEQAFLLACEARAKAILDLNRQGADYSDKHGL